MHLPTHLQVIENDTCAEHILLQGHQVWQAGIDDNPSPPPVDVHSVMLHEGLPLIPLLSPVFSQLVYLQRQRRRSQRLSAGSRTEVEVASWSDRPPLPRYYFLTLLTATGRSPPEALTPPLGDLCVYKFSSISKCYFPKKKLLHEQYF